jgi:ergothioneine biosynthesis protein EgtB
VTSVLQAFRDTRSLTERLAARLSPEDQQLQSMSDASPTKWHRAHTTWFFETFVLAPSLPGFRPFHPLFNHLFNSYYDHVGKRHARADRGLISRPTAEEISAYRKAIDAGVEQVLATADDALKQRVTLGINHEQQHQELLLTDIKHAFAQSIVRAPYLAPSPTQSSIRAAPSWRAFPEGLRKIGHGGEGFAFDNEQPSHPVWLQPFELGEQLVSNADYLQFIEAGGYREPTLWLSEGWDAVQRLGWTSPLYWELRDGAWWTFTLHGMQPVAMDEPVCHVSHFEADAYARWAKARLPTEAEWEVAAQGTPIEGQLLDEGRCHPAPSSGFEPFGNVWQWTSSAYVAYPGFRTAEGALGEYNGKFMSNQIVLRGGSCVTPRTHLRASYRNFFPSTARWQFSGVRLARDT